MSDHVDIADAKILQLLPKALPPYGGVRCWNRIVIVCDETVAHEVLFCTLACWISEITCAAIAKSQCRSISSVIFWSQ